MTKDELKRDIVRHICAYNRHMTEEYLMRMSWRQMICEVHPLYRDYFEDQLRKIKD